jgi:adenylate kinase family enzyme
MDPLDEYLQGTYLDEKRDITRVDTLLSDVWQSLTYTYTKKGWPYEFKDSGPLTQPDKWSYSTASMILFALASSIGLSNENALLPSVRIQTENRPEQKLKDTFWEVFLSLVDAIPKTKASKEPQLNCISSTFGKNDPFTLSWLLLLRQITENDPIHLKKLDDFQKAVETSSIQYLKTLQKNNGAKCFDLKEISKDAIISETDHVFPILRSIQLLRSLEEIESVKISKTIISFFMDDIQKKLLARIHQHLSFYEIPNSDFDAAELVFSLEGILRLNKQQYSIDRNLINRIFEVLDKMQKRSPYWRPLKPFLATNKGYALLPLSVEIANSLLRICQLLQSNDRVEFYFSKYSDLFKRYTDWLFTRVARISIYTDKEHLNITGWHSEHVHELKKIHSWETAQVALYLIYYRAMLQEHIARTSLAKANLKVDYSLRRDIEFNKYKSDPIKYWQKAWEDKAEPLSSLPAISPYRVLHEIGIHYISERIKNKGTPHYSMLLYGPSGTAKTTTAEEIAKTLNWPLITISPSNFIAKGESEVETRTKNIFQALSEQKEVVILFDEIDQLILDRDSKLYREQSDIFKFMTPGMLVKLKTLRDKKGPIFIIATNYEERIDNAAKRLGRIDNKFLIAPPDSIRRKKILEEQLEKAFKKRYSNDNIMSFKRKIKSIDFLKISKKTVFFAFGELKQISERVIENISGPNASAKEIFSSISDIINNGQTPVIRLSAYQSRFRKAEITGQDINRDFPTVQEPSIEYLMLLYLKCEIRNNANDEEIDLAKNAYNTALKENNISSLSQKTKDAKIKQLEKLIKDRKVAIRILQDKKLNTNLFS